MIDTKHELWYNNYIKYFKENLIMDMLKKLFPYSFGAKEVKDLVVKIIIYIIAGAIVGAIIGLLAAIPLIGIIFGLIGGLVELYIGLVCDFSQRLCVEGIWPDPVCYGGFWCCGRVAQFPYDGFSLRDAADGDCLDERHRRLFHRCILR